ncbi:MAG: hypothetical protein HOK13_02910, partial [Candidatus Puniceispirillum sp.]|nr:hypothetical protein [Candidatus Puniceispirillum sp.]
LAQEFLVDDQPGIQDPIGMSGVRLEADVHIVTGAVTSAQNICKSMEWLTVLWLEVIKALILVESLTS